MTTISETDTIDGWFGEGPRPALRVERLVRSYAGPPEILALAAVDLEVSPGELVAVVGSAGSGKTSLVRVLGLVDRPDAGRYFIDGMDVGELDDAERSRLRAGRIGLSLGPAQLLADRSVADNVDLALIATGTDRDGRRIRVADALARVSLEARAASPVGELSTGERRRVDLARALVRSPTLLIVDEPTRGLDGSAVGSLLALIRELHRTGLTIVVTTDDARVGALADRAVRLVRGRFEAEA